MFKKVLVANRGEIAVRIMRACRELGIRTVGVYSDADRNSIAAKYADESYELGGSRPAETYLNIRKIIAIAKKSGAEAIHPGYGFLAENPSFAYACEQAGLTFIGPSSGAIRLMGNKIAARKVMADAGIPVIPGSFEPVNDLESAKRVASSTGYPVLVKAAAGGGGIGISVVEEERQLEEAISATKKVAGSTVGDTSVFIEKFIPDARHIEFQVLADNEGRVVSLGERECSIQRRHQKLIEEAPSPVMTPELRRTMGEVAVKAARAIGYVNAGTVEFIYSNGDFYFLEMNTRIQVEHPLTEVVTGVDIAKEQIRIAAGLPLSVRDAGDPVGWAIECRINAEDPLNNFAPCPGKLRGYRSPGGIGIRVDSGVHTGYYVPPFYDPMISKLIAHGRNRDEAIERMRRALYEYVIVGVKTNIPFHKAVMNCPAFREGKLTTRFIDHFQVFLEKEMRRVIEEERTLEEKLASIFREEKKVAAASMAVKAYLEQVLSEEGIS
ncbi:MAG TPA: acetyl-CoA carboxylase biotin carboxylase subunit [Clostridia bacterium]|nr:acetyl-CoA carboxylase biotin carboxylase subunit [Clostridia bacterium]